MSQTRYEVVLSPRAKRAIERDLPEAVAFAVVDFLYGPLAEEPYRDRQAPSLGDYGLLGRRVGVSTASSTRSTRTGFWCASCASLTELTCTADAITDRSARATEAVCVCGMSPLGHQLMHTDRVKPLRGSRDRTFGARTSIPRR